MNIEEKLFKKTIINYNKLLAYGFTKENNTYKYSKPLIENLIAYITIDNSQKVTGKIYDLNFNEEYINFRINTNQGTFVNKVRQEYLKLLNNIIENCTTKQLFITPQANSITQKIKEIYNDEPEFMWDTSPGYGVFRNPITKKWYALIANIDRSKLDKNTSGEVEIINLKLNSNRITNLLERVGFYKAYHMNKKNWISIILDNTIKDEEIITYLKESYNYTIKNTKQTNLTTIPNIGSITKEDLQNIGINYVEDLKGKNPEELYLKDCQVKGRQEDKCQLYLFRMAVYYAEHDTREEEKLKWWYWKDKEYHNK